MSTSADVFYDQLESRVNQPGDVRIDRKPAGDFSIMGVVLHGAEPMLSQWKDSCRFELEDDDFAVIDLGHGPYSKQLTRPYVTKVPVRPYGNVVSESAHESAARARTIIIGPSMLGAGVFNDWMLGTTEPVNVDPVEEYRDDRKAAADSRDEALAEICRRLDAARARHAQRAPRDVVRDLVDRIGLSQLATARAVGVSPTAVRKWRRGEAARSEHRNRLARLAALSEVVKAAGVHDPGGWLEIPISTASTLTPLELFEHGRPELAVLFGSDLADPQETLDAFDSNWREHYAPDPDYEVVMLADGSRTAIPRREVHP